MPTLAQIFYSIYQTSPEKTAITLQQAGQTDQTISWEDLIVGSQAYAEAFTRQKIAAGEVVILILEHSEALIFSFLGAILGGQVPAIMPFLTEKLSPERYRADLANLISVTKPAAIVTSPMFETEIRAALVGDHPVRSVILSTSISSETDHQIDPLPGSEVSADSIAILQHSSGTTGLQKGVALSHRALLNQINAYRSAIRLGNDDVVVSWLPLYHDMGLIAGFLMPLLTGTPLVLMSPFDWVRAPQRLLQAVSQYRGTLTWLPNFAFNFCAQKIRDRHLEGVDLASWRAVINCSEPVNWDSHQLFFEKFHGYGLRAGALQTCYAMAENVFGVTQSDLSLGPVCELVDSLSFYRDHVIKPAQNDMTFLKLMSSGKPISNTRIRILDSDGQDMPDGHIGEIALISDSMLTGYYHRSDLTKKAFRDGWYLTGDFGYQSNGELFVTGRKKDLIIIGGKNIYPQDLEMLVNQVEGVHSGRAAAFGVFDATQGTEAVVIVAEVDDLSPENQKILSDEIRLTIAKNSAVTVKTVHLVGAKWLIKTSSGKIARSANRDKFLAETGGFNLPEKNI